MALSRRGLFRGLFGAAGAAAAAGVAAALPEHGKTFVSGPDDYRWVERHVRVTVSAGRMDEIITATMKRRTRALADNVTNHIPLLKRLKHGG